MSATALVLGQGLQAYSSYMGGVERQAAYNLQAQSRVAQAMQVQIGADRELRVLQRKGEMIQGAQVSAYGHSGVQATSGSPLLQMEQTKQNVMEEMQAVADAANYHKTSLLTDAYADNVFGQQAYNSGVLGAVGAGVGVFSKNPTLTTFRAAPSASQGGFYDGSPRWDRPGGLYDRKLF